jgi:hypothetical protein
MPSPAFPTTPSPVEKWMAARSQNRVYGLQFPTAKKSFCVPLTPPKLNVKDAESLAAMFGTITLN